MKHTTLISTEALAARLSDHSLVVVDCRFDLANTEAGERDYAHAHIPGALYAHLDRDLSSPKTGTNGRHPLPSPEALIATLGRLGVGEGVQVVAYDQDTGMYASRLWWLLRWMGHDAVAVLDGGFAKWTAERRATAHGVEAPTARTFVGAPHTGMTATPEEVASISASPGSRLVDARAPERFRGDIEPLDPVAGRIPGAVNHCYQLNLEAGRFRSPDELRATLRKSLGEVRGEDVVCYCGSGVTACHNVLALEHAGLRGARLYPGSWSEWVADPKRPVERG